MKKAVMTENEKIGLKEYFETRLKILEKEINSAAILMDKRLEGMNEFRESLKDQASKFMTINEFNIIHRRIEEDIRILRESKANLEGKASQTSVFIAYGIAIIGLIIAIIGLFKIT